MNRKQLIGLLLDFLNHKKWWVEFLDFAEKKGYIVDDIDKIINEL